MCVTNMRDFRISLLMWSSLTAVAIAPAAARAQENTGTYDDIVVTAQKRSEALQDVPISISVVSADDLAKAGVGGILQLQQSMPGVLIAEGPTAGQPYIRGVGGPNITQGNEPTTAIYVDGVYQIGKAGMLVSQFTDVQSIQVLRGPQGTLFGRNATSGAILISTRTPEYDLGGRVSAKVGNQEWGGDMYVTGGLGENAAFIVSGYYQRESDYIENMNPDNGLGDKVGSTESYGIRAKLRIEPSDHLTITLSGNWMKGYDEGNFAQQQLEGSIPSVGDIVLASMGSTIDLRRPRSYFGEIEPGTRFEGWGGALTLDWDVGFASVKSITSYSGYMSGVRFDLDTTPVSIFFYDAENSGRAFQQEVNLTSNSSGPLNWIVGAYYLDFSDGADHLDLFLGLPVPDRFTPGQPPLDTLLALSALGVTGDQVSFTTQKNRVQINSLGLFGEVSYNLSEATKATVGLRYTKETHKLDPGGSYVSTFPDGEGGVGTASGTNQSICDATPDCSLRAPFEQLTYRFVLDHRFNQDLMAYASYNRGFKSGVFNTSGFAPANLVATKPEIIDAIEVGFKSSFADHLLEVNGAFYFYDYKNLQVQVVDASTNTQRSINAASAKINGMELEGTINPAANFNIKWSFAHFFKSEYTSFENCELYAPTPAGPLLVSGNCTGQDMPFTPDVTFTVAPNLTIPLKSGANVDLSASYSFMSEYDQMTHGFYEAGVSPITGAFPAGEGRAPIQKAINMLNLSATYRFPDDRMYISLWARNVLGTDIVRALVWSAFGYSGQLNRGPTYGATIGLGF